jgi:hypothetical protein
LQVCGDQVEHADHQQFGAAHHEHAEEQRGQDEIRPARAQRGLAGTHVHLSIGRSEGSGLEVGGREDPRGAEMGDTA